MKFCVHATLMAALLCAAGAFAQSAPPAAEKTLAGDAVALTVLPAEHVKMKDDQTGAELTFLTSAPSQDCNLYFHEWSWLADNSLILFNSNRDGGKQELTGYITATGELVRLRAPQGSYGNATAAVDKTSVYAVRDGKAVELALDIQVSPDPKKQPSKVFAAERVIATLPAGAAGALNPNASGKMLACGVVKTNGQPARVITIDIEKGEVKTVHTVPNDMEFAYHVQWSHVKPYLLSFAAIWPRLNVLDVRTGRLTNPYKELKGELVTHEHWWVDDQIVFCGGLHPKPTEDASVKLVNINTGKVRLLGAGTWWKDATPAQISKYNFWHCAGSDDGRWVVADNWHGDITLFDALTARPHLLTQGHRVYGGQGGQASHPHVGWDRKGEQVIFCSWKRGNADVCVATIPKEFQQANEEPKREPRYHQLKARR